MNHFYTGIGSRKTPDVVLTLMECLAAALADRQMTLRSGGADGADMAFFNGTRADDDTEIYLPWPGFNGWSSPHDTVCDAALAMAESIHPNWAACSAGARKLHARNCYQVLGEDLKTPSRFVLCWTPDGCDSEETRTRHTGGTGLAIALASRHGIPVYNLHNEAALERATGWLNHIADRQAA